MNSIDHNHIDQFDLDQYLLGKLAAEESAVLEEHFVDCSQCIHRLQTTRDFLQALRLVAVQDASKAADNPRPEMRRYFWRTPFRNAFAVAVCALLAAAILGVILAINQIRRLRYEVMQAQSISAEWERRFEEERQAALLAHEERQGIERELTAQLRQMEADRQREQEHRAVEAGAPTALMRPGMNVPIFSLNAVTRSEQGPVGSASEVPLPRSPTAFILLLPLEVDLKYEDYRVSISDDRDRRMWSRKGFQPNRYGSLSVVLDSSSFRPGDYLLTVGGVTKQRGLTPLGTYPIRIIKH